MAEEVIAGRYRLLQPLGRGAMSAVWEADDTELGRRVAVKLLGPTADPQRFEREARAAAALSHPNIVSVYDYGRDEGRPFMVLELLPGGSLEDRLRDGRPLADDETLAIALEIASGLAHAHERGLVHRDLKPANILFDGEGRAKIADFGIVRVGGGGTLTEAGTVLGTASYISPEQATGEPAGPASDVFSFGVILFRLLTGRLPFVSKNAVELVRMHRDEKPPRVAELRPDAPAPLAALAGSALSKDPNRRPQDGAALLLALRDDGSATTQILRPAASPPRRDRRRVLSIALVAGVLLVAGTALAIAVTRGGGDGGGATSTTPGLSLPTVAPTTSASTTTTAATTTTAPATTTAPTTTTPVTSSAPVTTTAPATTTPTTTAAATTTTPVTTTAPTTTAPTTTAPVTTAPTTTAATTTAPTTT